MTNAEAETYLRGSLNARYLQGDAPAPAIDNSSKSFLVFCSLIVGAVGLCYIYCMYVAIRRWLCCIHDDDELEENRSRSVLVHDGMVFNLNTAQRRAILEVIFSETSMPAPGKEEKKKKKKSRKEDADEEVDTDSDAETEVVDIPLTITLSSTYHDFSASAHEEQPEEPVPPLSPQPPTRAVTPLCITPDVVIQAASIPLPDSPVSTTPVSPPRKSWPTPMLGVSTATNTPTASNIRRSFPISIDSPSQEEIDECLTTPGDLELPVLTEEECKEEDGMTPRLYLPPSIAPNLTAGEASVISSHFEYDYDDETTDENVCAICLNGYEEGELLISSKHCSHLFHKDCILEWLDKHDGCPCCRVDMVTDSEINQATTAYLGKTRMYRAVALRQVGGHLSPAVSSQARASSSIVGPAAPRVRRLNGDT